MQSLDAGFQRALATIVDANLTTLIAAVMLFYLGSGPVRGFAVTFAIGIVTTVFTAFTLTRWLIVALGAPHAAEASACGSGDAILPDNPADPLHELAPVRVRVFGDQPRLPRSLSSCRRHELRRRLQGRLGHRGQGQRASADPGDIRAALAELNLGDVQVQEIGSRAKC